MRTGFMIAVLLAILTTAPVSAQDTASGRYTMTPAGQDMLRLDTQSGTVSRCMRDAGNWVCKSIADDRLALENEIDRLSRENRQLRAELAKRGPETMPQAKPRPGAPKSWLPDDKDVEEFMSFFEKIMRRFKQIAESMQGDAAPERP